MPICDANGRVVEVRQATPLADTLEARLYSALCSYGGLI